RRPLAHAGADGPVAAGSRELPRGGAQPARERGGDERAAPLHRSGQRPDPHSRRARRAPDRALSLPYAEPAAEAAGAAGRSCRRPSPCPWLQPRNADGRYPGRRGLAQGAGGVARTMMFALVLSNLAGGGAERAMLRLAVALKRRGHGVRVIVLDPRIEHEVPPELELHTLDTRKGLLGAWLAARALRGLYRRLGLGTDCVTISTLPFADLVAARANVANLWCRITNTLSAEI